VLLFKLEIKVNLEILKIMGVQEEKRGGAGRRSQKFIIVYVKNSWEIIEILD